MDTRNSKTNRRTWLAMLVAAAALFLAGCDVKLTDLTPSSMKANPSRAYAVTAQVTVKNNAVVEGSVKPEIIIDGRAHPMAPVPGSDSLFEFDYRMPPGRSKAAYYILVRYERKTASATVTKEIYTEPRTFEVENRYSVELEVNRAPVGTRVAILGRGFTMDDKVMVGGTPALTQVESSTSIAFYVPSLPEGRNYNVTVLGLNGELSAGSLRVDASNIHVTPSSLSINSGGRALLTFSIPTEAPPGGLAVTVTTDVPDSVIMPEVVIPAGQRSTSVRVQGGDPGSGNLFVELGGYSDVVIPITVN
ncbi:IPT/TIG domain-containing protein [Pelagicoccus sp. SDUM812003]|uniref:IPT/TIG domain-containing protein n=1 Tax=Pelagicoccus sp. SDUM812003 TaxID=3041267 RepID=UPI0028101C00|nr:IPT/TIG domain-containing protein [Pelagicoccus sp. SDUM812003]MDQ8205438.1 IPT/TIG domain-containing protein [Pelagicoccus sp. SDUM812003]